MADLLLGPLIKIVMQKATDSLVQRIGEMWGVQDQRERLHDKLLAVQAVLADAEDKGASNPAVKNWMLKLKLAAYDADDVLDEFCYEELRQDAVQRGHKVGNNVSGLCSLKNPALFRSKMSRKLKKVVVRIEEIVAEMGKFGFAQGQRVPVVHQVRTCSHVFESKVMGRDEDRENIVKLLLEVSSNTDLTVVPVVGMGGIGKTTLVQLVYNDYRVKELFKLSLWVCVSEEFNIGLLMKSIVELVKGDCNVSVDNIELLNKSLCEVLGGKRYLLVLDDVWNENDDKWERLRDLLTCGDPGSAIIVTTRSDKVGSIMGTVKNYNLGFLCEEDSWILFDKRVFSKGVKKCQELVEIGHKLVQTCRGLPLAINALSSLMSYKHEVREWLAILEESDIWDKRPAKEEVLPVLRLSYEHLPSYMKQCFAFCAVFPKDHEMDKDKLIQYWMANGFIPSNRTGNLEMSGNDIFNELAWRSFFQDIKQVSYGCRSRVTCKMHDMMHDLAQSIMGDECLFMLELPAQPTKPIITTRHILLETTPLDINIAMDCYPYARSLILYPDHNSRHVQNIGFIKSNVLRILNLEIILPIERTIVTPEKMKHLRYLEISDDNIKSLPEEISILYLLQTLRLSGCGSLEKLPEGMQYMSSLRHLYIEDCDNLKNMPSGLGQLHGLQTLTNYIIGADAHNGIAELENLNLHGQLHLYNLQEVKDVADARKAKLIAKQNLNELTLCWGMPDYVCYDESNAPKVIQNSFEVLDALIPCNKLKMLQIILYSGAKFPIWVTEYQMLENMIELYIIECRECTKIPSVENLPFLRILKLKHLNKLRHLCNNSSTSHESGEDVQIAFPSLEYMKLSDMPKLRSWWKGEVRDETSLVFPQLLTLRINNCPKLTTLPNVPLIEDLSVKENKILSRIAARLTAVQNLSLGSHDRGAEGPSEYLSFQPWENLETLCLTGYSSIVPICANVGKELGITITQCRRLDLYSCNFDWSHIPSNMSLWFWKCFTFLQVLYIKECNSLIYWPEEFRSLNNLIEIIVTTCQNFLGTQLESPVGRSITEVLLPKLQDLFIVACPNLIEIPKCSRSIKSMTIWNCSKLRCLPEWLGSMIALKRFTIQTCKSLDSLPLSIGCLTNLEYLCIDDCPNLAYLPEGMDGLQALEELEIKSCPKIRVLPEGLLQQLTNLDELWIIGCPHLERHFGKLGKYQYLISKIRIAKIGEKEKSGILRDLLLLVPSCKITCFSAQS